MGTEQAQEANQGKPRRRRVVIDPGELGEPLSPDDMGPDSFAEGDEADRYRSSDVAPPEWPEEPEDLEALRETIAAEQEGLVAEYDGPDDLSSAAWRRDEDRDGYALDAMDLRVRGEDDEDHDSRAGIIHAPVQVNEMVRRQAPEMIERSIAAAASKRGITLDDVRAVFDNKKGGRPSAAMKAQREMVREILQPTWDRAAARDASGNRSLIADVLGCSRMALYNLMGENLDTHPQ